MEPLEKEVPDPEKSQFSGSNADFAEV